MQVVTRPESVLEDYPALPDLKKLQDTAEEQRLQNFEMKCLEEKLSKARYLNHELEDKVTALEKAIVVLTDALRK
jgi:hypothetical protein